MFVLLSDGEAWSGEVAKSLKKAQRTQRADLRGRRRHAGRRRAAGLQGRTRRDRATIRKCRPRRGSIAQALQRIAVAGGGQYFELDRDGDRHIANAIIDAGKRMAPSLGAVRAVRGALLALSRRRSDVSVPRPALPARAPGALDSAVGAAACSSRISTILRVIAASLASGISGLAGPGVRCQPPTS